MNPDEQSERDAKVKLLMCPACQITFESLETLKRHLEAKAKLIADRLATL